MSAIVNNDAPIETTSGSLDEGADAFLKLWEDAEEPSSPEDDEDTSETEDDSDESEDDEADEPDESEDDDEDSEDTDDEDEDDDEPSEKDKKVLKDDAVVKIKVGDEELAVPVEKLKRLYGQEAALTRKSQEVAATRKQLEETGARQVAASEALLTKAKSRFEPYANIDWLVAAQQLEPGELQVLRDEARKAYEDVKFLESDLDAFMESAKKTRQEEINVEAKKTWEELQDPATGIKGWSQETYKSMLDYAVSVGVPQEVAFSTTSAPLFRILHKAMMFDKGQKVVTKATDKKPKKIIKSRNNSESSAPAFKPQAKNKALNKLKQSGNMDDAANAFLASFMED